MSNYIISASTILPVSQSPIENCSVAVSNGRITDIGSTKELVNKYGGFTRIDLGNGILMPGFINCHVHLELEWIRPYIGEFKDFPGWLENIMKARSSVRIDTGRINESVRNGISELIKCGVTTVGEISSLGKVDEELLRNSGLRTILFREITDSNLPETDWEQFGVQNDTFEVRPFPHAPYSCSPSLISQVLDFSINKELPFGIHLAESPDEVRFVRNEHNSIEENIYKLIGKKSFTRHKSDSPVGYILDGFSKAEDAKITAVHMVQVDKSDVMKIRNSSTAIVLCPRSNQYLNVGEPPVDLYRELNRVGIGTDGVSSNKDLNFFSEIRCLNSIASGIPVTDVEQFTVYAATLGGAKALFIEDRTGSIEVDKLADLIFINNSTAGSDPYKTVVNSTADDVGFVMIGGQIVKAGND